MMKMSGRVTGCCVVLFLVLASVSAAHKRLNSIKDLKKIDFGQSVPKHSLLLLHWFANTVDIDNNNVIRLTFDPNSGDYGSHHYGNYERLLDPLPRGYRYYTLGNLYQGTSTELPSYVVNPRWEYEGRNRDRIIIRVQENTGRGVMQRIDQVYMTQHYDTSENQGTPYDPAHTYQITVNLVRQIREFSVRDSHLPLLHLRNRYGSNADDSHIRVTWGNLACLGLLLYIVIEEKNSSNQGNNRRQNNNRPQNNRPQNNNRPQHNYRPQDSSSVNNYRAESNYRPQNNSSPECRECSQCCKCAFLILILILISLIIFLSILFASKKDISASRAD